MLKYGFLNFEMGNSDFRNEFFSLWWVDLPPFSKGRLLFEMLKNLLFKHSNIIKMSPGSSYHFLIIVN